MKTIVQGDKTRLLQPKYFECSHCGWVGKANKDEYEYCGNQYEGDEWKVKCACCGNIAYTVPNSDIPKYIEIENTQFISDSDYPPWL